MSKEKGLNEFIQTVNEAIINIMFNKREHALEPSKKNLYVMQNIQIQINARVTLEGKVTDDPNAVSLHLAYDYISLPTR